MAVSLANVLTPHLWRGEPKVVIRGKFTLGLTSVSSGSSPMFIAPFLYFGAGTAGGLASGLAGGGTFSMQIEGRQAYAAAVYDSHIETGIEYFRNWAQDVATQDSPYYGVDPYYAVYQNNSSGFAQTAGLGPSVQAISRAKPDALSFTDVSVARSAYSIDFGAVVASDLRITLRGALQRLDLTRIQAVGFNFSADNYRAEIAAVQRTNVNSSATVGSGLSGRLAGWHPVDVHIYDNPQLRGNIVSGGVPVIWG